MAVVYILAPLHIHSLGCVETFQKIALYMHTYGVVAKGLL